MSIKSGAKTKKLGVAGETLAKPWHRDNCSHAKNYNKNIETMLATQNVSLLIWDRHLKFMLQHPTVWFDRKQSKYPSEELLLHEFLNKRSTDVWKTVTKQPLQTTVSINLWKIFAGHTGDWFDVKTALICTTELWDTLKSFILTSLKIKVAPYPLIVSLDTLNGCSEIISCPIFKTNIFGCRSCIDLSNDTLFVKIRWENLTQWLSKCYRSPAIDFWLGRP